MLPLPSYKCNNYSLYGNVLQGIDKVNFNSSWKFYYIFIESINMSSGISIASQKSVKNVTPFHVDELEELRQF